jgi:glycosyltransferase involved in cell wall biosynthesis
MRARAVFAIPGDLASMTGGYAYDREIIARAPKFGVVIDHLALPANFPLPDADDLRETARLLKQVPEDVVLYIDGLAFGAFTPDLLAAIGQKIVVHVHHPLALETGLSEARMAAFRTSERIALVRAAHVIVPSGATRAVLVADYGVPAERITIALPGTDRAPRAPRRGGTPQILAVGSVVPRKAYGIFVAALAMCRDLDWSATIAGSLVRAPEHVEALRDMIAREDLEARIRLAGEVDPPTLEALYQASDVFVLSSHYEGYGMVLAEAMIRGLPIVTTTGGAAADTVPDGAALKVPPGDVYELACALRRMIARPAFRAKMADASFAAGQDLPDWDDTARIVADVLVQVAGGVSR